MRDGILLQMLSHLRVALEVGEHLADTFGRWEGEVDIGLGNRLLLQNASFVLCGCLYTVCGVSVYE